ncbi:MAG: hypothetical protein AAGA56_06700 [Myxococcota bacterium]
MSSDTADSIQHLYRHPRSALFPPGAPSYFAFARIAPWCTSVQRKVQFPVLRPAADLGIPARAGERGG